MLETLIITLLDKLMRRLPVLPLTQRLHPSLETAARMGLPCRELALGISTLKLPESIHELINGDGAT